MTLSPSFRQTAPDRLEIRSGGGCASLFGLPLFVSGIFIILAVFQVVPFSNAGELPFWSWPVLLLMGLVFVAVGGGLVFGRTRIVVDVVAGTVVKEQRALVLFRREEHRLLDYRAVALTCSEGDADSSPIYGVSLQRRDGRADLALFSLTEYGPALSQAAPVAQALGLPLVDTTTDHETIVELDRAGAGEPLRARLARDRERPFEEIAPPATLLSDVHVEGQTVRIWLPNPAFTPVGLVLFLFPLAILIWLGPKLLSFFSATETPESVQVCVFAFMLLFFLGFPLLELVNGYRRSRVGGTTVTASPDGLTLEQRQAWRRSARTIPAVEIVGLDFSTPESAWRSAQRAGAQYGARHATPITETSATGAALHSAQPDHRRWLGRLVKGRGVIVKTRQGLVEFGAGLPGPEIHYLWALLTRALAGALP